MHFWLKIGEFLRIPGELFRFEKLVSGQNNLDFRDQRPRAPSTSCCTNMNLGRNGVPAKTSLTNSRAKPGFPKTARSSHRSQEIGLVRQVPNLQGLRVTFAMLWMIKSHIFSRWRIVRPGGQPIFLKLAPNNLLLEWWILIFLVFTKKNWFRRYTSLKLSKICTFGHFGCSSISPCNSWTA